ncbi:MAG: hypothetical protein ACXVNM_10470, partial [Bacteroidia bacterium]
MFFRRKPIDFESESLSTQTWRRFKRNKLSMLGLVIIVISCIISILGYLITPDRTPYANDQKPELHIKDPGFSARFLLSKRNDPESTQSIFKTMLIGRFDPFDAYTVHIYLFKNQNIIVEEYTGNTPNKGTITKLNIA